ncbi:hypothetical protein DSO57_1033986 [Entomophthora muscae]|uniref:Uncharacterized protein n=1 Tax=Entomophthora muscae TaxID=34485 RepID=A0ACC2T007_9FUNG|nr:hypothetical protein DSO57_1033986 [Entomophthora muscae]
MEEISNETTSLENKIILEDKEDEYQLCNETLRIGKFKSWFYNEAKDTQVTQGSSSREYILQQILSALSPRLKRDLDDLSKKLGSSASQGSPQVIVADEFVSVYFFVPDSSRIDSPRFRVLPPKMFTEETCSQEFSALRYRHMAVFLAVHPSPSRIRKMLAEDPSLERGLEDVFAGESATLLTSHKIAAQLLTRFKVI